MPTTPVTTTLQSRYWLEGFVQLDNLNTYPVTVRGLDLALSHARSLLRCCSACWAACRWPAAAAAAR